VHTQTESQCTETHSQGVASTLDPLTENENAPIADRSSLGQTLLELLHIQNISATRWSVFRALDHETGLSAVELYDSMAVALPCALRPDIGLETLLNGRPFFLLAVIVTATSSQPGLQTEAEEVFRHALAGKAIIEGQRSMEILQGLLTYLLWYQHCFNQQTQQYYQYLSLALGMMADLGLHKFEVNIGQGTSQACHINQARTLLLCYYLSCGASVLAFDRPESMQCIGSVRKAATILSDVKERAVGTKPLQLWSRYFILQHKCMVRSIQRTVHMVLYLQARYPCFWKDGKYDISTGVTVSVLSPPIISLLATFR